MAVTRAPWATACFAGTWRRWRTSHRGPLPQPSRPISACGVSRPVRRPRGRAGPLTTAVPYKNGRAQTLLSPEAYDARSNGVASPTRASAMAAPIPRRRDMLGAPSELCQAPSCGDRVTHVRPNAPASPSSEGGDHRLRHVRAIAPRARWPERGDERPQNLGVAHGSFRATAMSMASQAPPRSPRRRRSIATTQCLDRVAGDGHPACRAAARRS